MRSITTIFFLLLGFHPSSSVGLSDLCATEVWLETAGGSEREWTIMKPLYIGHAVWGSRMRQPALHECRTWGATSCGLQDFYPPSIQTLHFPIFCKYVLPTTQRRKSNSRFFLFVMLSFSAVELKSFHATRRYVYIACSSGSLRYILRVALAARTKLSFNLLAI